jgi:hypothetical protein
VHPQVPPLQIPLAQSLFCVQVGGVHVPPQKLPAPQSALDVQALGLQTLLRHRAPMPVPQSEFTAQVGGGVQVAPEQEPAGQSVSTSHFDALHVAPRHVLPATVQSVSTSHAALLHVAPEQTALAGQAASPVQLADVHVAPLQTPPVVPQFASALQAPDVHVFVATLQWPPVPHCSFVTQAPAPHTPVAEPPNPAPHEPLSQSVFAWQA